MYEQFSRILELDIYYILFLKNLFIQFLFPFIIQHTNGVLALVTPSLENLIVLQISLIKFLVIDFVLIFIFSAFISFFKQNNGIKVYPFEVFSDLKEYNGKVVSERLIFEFQRIWKIHQNANQTFNDDFFKTVFFCYEKFLSIEQSGKKNPSLLDKLGVESQAGVLASENVLPFKVNFYSENIETIISNVGDISFAGVTLPLGGLILIIKQLLTPFNSNQYITGSLQENDSKIRLIASMEGRNRHRWELTYKKNKSNNEDSIIYLTRELAFRIIHDLLLEKDSKDEWPKPKTWECFNHYTEAIDSYIFYINTRRLKHIESSRINCIRGLEYEKDYLPLFNLFFFLGVEYYLTEDYYLSEDILRQCIGHVPQEENVYNILSDILLKLGRVEEALETAEKAIEIKPDLAIAWGNVSLALFNLGRYEEALKASEKAINLNEM